MAGKPAILKVDIIADAKGVGKGVDEADRKLSGLAKIGGKVGKGVALGMAAGVVAVGAFAAASIGAASQVEQSMGAVESVFGAAADTVKGYAAGAATSLGLAKSQYAGLAATVGSQLQGMGLDQAASAEQTQALITKGADLAATFGGSVTDAVGAVGSLLRGERDPIEAYGVSLTAADVAARLAAEGNDKLTGAALKNAQAVATLDLLNEKTTNSTGAFGRESNTLAGQQERLRAQFENVKATVGAGLTPILTALFTFIGTSLLPKAQELGAELRDRLGPFFARVGAVVTGQVVPALGTATAFVKNNATTVKVLGGVLLAVGAALVVYSATVKTVSAVTRAYAAVQGILNAVLTANPIGLVVVALVAIGAALVLAYRKSETFRNAVDGLFGFLKKLVGFTPLGALLTNLDSVKRAADKVKEALGKVVDLAKRAGSVVGGLNPFSAPVLDARPQLVGGYGGGLVSPGLATAALGDVPLLSRMARSSAAVSMVDARSYPTTITVNGALDAPAVADQVRRILARQADRLGIA